MLYNVSLAPPNGGAPLPTQLKLKRLDCVLWNLWSPKIYTKHIPEKNQTCKLAVYLIERIYLGTVNTPISEKKDECFTYRVDLWPL